MIYKMYTIYDRKANMYGTPFYQINDNTAVRFYTGIANKDKALAMDTELYYVGEFNSATAELTCEVKPIFVINGSEVVND